MITLNLSIYTVVLLIFLLQVSASGVEHILEEFKGPGGLNIDGIKGFKSPEAVHVHWAKSSKHLSCMQVRLHNGLLHTQQNSYSLLTEKQ